MFFTKTPKNQISFHITDVFATRWTFAAKLSRRESPIEIRFNEVDGRVSIQNANELSQDELNMVAQASSQALQRLIIAHKANQPLSSVTLTAN